MSYQVLARKWRPKRFAELVGQEHVVRALTHALDSGRVHHAFLFTGTRGVGKTTIARILAKSLNCERGMSAEPCGECSACRDIDAGRYLDLLEIDAASNTGVDDVRELIENAQYRPARGSYKVYLIDEVHMLSKNAFNALLKTLEEPPEHAKFLLATTDPQKLPVTVLSRCLQFNLKLLSQEQIAAQLKMILDAEQVAADPAAIRDIAHAGNGSVRDALSLLDQAIMYGGGELRADEVRTMLGTIDPGKVLALLEAIVAGDAAAMLALIDEAAEFAPDFGTVLDELADLLHRIQLAQFVPGTAGLDESEIAATLALAERLHAEEVQLLYQIAICGRRDLGLAPSPRAGFEMSLLRMLAFRPGADGADRKAATTAAAGTARAIAPTTASAPPAMRGAAATRNTPPQAPHRAEPATPVPRRDERSRGGAECALDPERWASILENAGLRGPLRELAINSVPLGLAEGRLRLGLKPAHQHFRSDALTRQLADALALQLGDGLRVQFENADGDAMTMADRARQNQAVRHTQAEAALAADPVVQTLISQFDARVVPNTTRPRD